ncbi:VanZ family protein [Streptomyces phaeofaciens JCM 4814]|uniref:VanZ family protein n=1 Tax=Streptomyces phaeofaciens TaxID=68254 RepID=A0A918H1T6_9ACTN|nr:VanZ family protein [Streptomyces phaeofaciens]
MPRAAPRPRSLFRLRTAKSEDPPKPAPAGTPKPAGKPGPARKARPTGGSGAKAGGPGKSRAAGPAKVKPAGSAKTERAGRGKGEPAPTGPRPLPLLLRLPAMLCAFAFMVGFAVVLARLTLEPSPASAALVHSNLRPGDSLRAYLDQPALRDAVKQIGGNILLGVPFGVLVPVVAPQARGLLRVLLLTASVMLLVEFAQGALVTGRAFDIDDVILNTTGALIGWLLLGRRVGRAVHARRQRP